MHDIVGRVFSYLFGIVCMFLVGLVIMFNINDSSMQSYLNNKTSVFVDTSRANNRIDPFEYRAFVEDINKTMRSYEVKILVSRPALIPNQTGGYDTMHSYYNKEDIVDYMYNSSGTPVPFELKNGDHIQVSIRSLKGTDGSRILGFFTTNKTGIPFTASSAGYVGNGSH